ncbi:MAG: hypothetical protein IJN15_04810 [Clostridia bacterium]|nr:hypothetical protein [Clostridia bacterium]
MKGSGIFDNAMKLLGYTDSSGEIQDSTGLKARATAAINRIIADLKLNIFIEKLTDEISISQSGEDALIYGTAMLLALSDNDGSKNQLFASIYNAKRSAFRGNKTFVKDNLPVANEV